MGLALLPECRTEDEKSPDTNLIRVPGFMGPEMSGQQSTLYCLYDLQESINSCSDIMYSG
jgi:hypothetical protein